MVDLATTKNIVFLTGDLGFMALEPLQQALNGRFINAGVAEQNMIGVAAGLASGGEQCWAYSIGPFIYARPFEQIRNDICLHDFDVKLVGNGGGYGYGVMGATHHSLEDYGALCALQNMTVYVPAFSDDIGQIVSVMAGHAHPAYLRLGRCEKPTNYIVPSYAPWRRLLRGNMGLVLAAGAGVGGLLAEALELPENGRPEIWVVTELPLNLETIPTTFLSRISQANVLGVMEEHVAQGGVGQMLAYALLKGGFRPTNFRHFHANGYLSKRYGSQSYHRNENGLSAAKILSEMKR